MRPPFSFALVRLGSTGVRVALVLGALSLAAPAAEGPQAQAESPSGEVAVDTVPEPKLPFQVIAVAGALLIWRNRRRTR